VTGNRAAGPAQIEDLVALLECESPSADLAATADCANLAAEIGARWTGERGELIPAGAGRLHVRWQFGRPTRVLVLGHLDTVWPKGTLARWPVDIRGDRISAPGVFDMKGGVIEIFSALRQMLGQMRSLDGICVLLTTDEEIGSPTSRALIEQSARGAEAVLVAEPNSDGAVKVARKGVSLFSLQIQGRAAHAGTEPDRGVNASVELARQVLSVTGLSRPEHGTTVTPTVASAGTTSNTVPATARLDIDVRAQTLAEQERVRAALLSLRPALAGVRLNLESGPSRPPFEADTSQALFTVAQAVAAELGRPGLRGVSAGGGSDGNFTAALGIPTLDGLGVTGGGAHAEGEWASLGSLSSQAEFLATLLRRLLS
jgi:glutamate carboxypeptidase